MEGNFGGGKLWQLALANEHKFAKFEASKFYFQIHDLEAQLAN